jgi:hypothetical protein
MIPMILLRGLVIRDGWGWFIAPLGVPHLTLLHAAGLSGFVALLTHQRPSREPDFWPDIAHALIHNLISWGVLALIHGAITHGL